MRSLCFYFQVHQPLRLKRYRFFNIGKDHHYYDDYQNRYIMRRVADKCYLPTNALFLELIQKYGERFKISFSISGVAIKQFELYAPEVIESFKRLAETGCVEFIAETYGHSLAALRSPKEFREQVAMQVELIEKHFGCTPETFRNTELIYDDQIGAMVADMGYHTMLAEGAKHVLGWKSPNFIYSNAINPRLKLLLKNFRLSDDIAFRFSQHTWPEWPLTTEKWVGWLNAVPVEEEVVNLFMDYETFGEHQWPETGIFEFLRHLPERIYKHSNFVFRTPSEVAALHIPIAPIHVPYPMSWADEERDLTAWLGNELQDEAFDKLYQLESLMDSCVDPHLLSDWKYLQTSDHFYYMCTKFFADGDVHKYFNPYDTPYDAFINFMNVLSDFKQRLEHHVGAIMHQIGKGSSRLAPLAPKADTEEMPKTKKAKTSKNTKETKAAKGKSKKVYINDVIEIDDKIVKKVIKEVGHDTLIIALKGLSNKVKLKFFGNIPQKTAHKLEKNLGVLTNIPRSDIRKARNAVEEAMRNML